MYIYIYTYIYIYFFYVLRIPLCYVKSTKLIRDNSNSECHFTNQMKSCALNILRPRRSKIVLATTLQFLKYCV